MPSPKTQPGEADPKFARDAWLRALAKTANIGEQGITLPTLMERLAGEFKDAPALISPEATLSYGQLGLRSNQYSRWGIAQGLKNGDAVSLLMTNCAEYPAIWLGLTRIGAAVALVNSQLAGDVLAHSINIANPKRLIVGADLAQRVAAIRARLPPGLACKVSGGTRRAGLHAARCGACLGIGRAAACCGVRTGNDRCHGALYLYVGHDRPAQGGQGQPLPADAVESLVCRNDGYQTQRSHVQLSAALSQRRRCGCDLCNAGQRRRGGDPSAIFCVGFLARRARRALHAVSIHRRTLPLLGQYAAPSPRDRALAEDRLRQRPAAGSLDTVPEPLQDSANPGVLRLHGREFFALQLRGPARRDRPHPGIFGRPIAGCAAASSTSRSRNRGATPRDFASAARSTRSAKRWA